MIWVDLSHTACSSNVILYICSIFVCIGALDRGGGVLMSRTLGAIAFTTYKTGN